MREEVTRQLANIDDIVAQEVTEQLAMVDDIVRQEVTRQLATIHDIVREEVNSQMAPVHDIVRQEVTSQVASLDTLTVSELHVRNKEDKSAVMTGTGPSAGIIILNSDGEHVANLGTHEGNGVLDLFYAGEVVSASLVTSVSGHGILLLGNSNGDLIVQLGGQDDGLLYLINRDGEIVAGIGSSSYGNGYISIFDKYGGGLL